MLGGTVERKKKSVQSNACVDFPHRNSWGRSLGTSKTQLLLWALGEEGPCRQILRVVFF